MIPCEQLERWKALADAATPGPWEYLDVAGYPEIYQAPATYDVDTVFSATSQGAENAEFAAAARLAVPILLAEVESQAKEIERLRERERAARIEAVEEFRERARGECYDDGGESGWLAHTIAKRIAALPALPEEP